MLVCYFQILRHGVGLSTSSDSEVITQLLARPPPNEETDGPDWLGRIQQLIKETLLSYSLLIMYGESVYAVRDPYGNRPLCIGRLMGVGYNAGMSSFSLFNPAFLF